MRSLQYGLLCTLPLVGCFMNPFKQAANQQSQMNSYVAEQNAKGMAQQTASYEQQFEQSRSAYKASPDAGHAMGFATTVEFSYVSALGSGVPLKKAELLTEARGYLSDTAKAHPSDAARLTAEEGFLLMVFGEKAEAQSVLEASNQKTFNPYTVPYLGFLYDDQDKTQDVKALCKKGLSASPGDDLRYTLMETCYSFTRSTSVQDMSAWSSKADLDLYQKRRAQTEAEISKNKQENVSAEEHRCLEQAQLYDSFPDKGARDSALRCDGAEVAASARYISMTEVIRGLVPRTLTLKNSCSKTTSLYISAGVITPSSPKETLQPGEQRQREVRAYETVVLEGATSVMGAISLKSATRSIEVHSNCILLQPS